VLFISSAWQSFLFCFVLQLQIDHTETLCHTEVNKYIKVFKALRENKVPPHINADELADKPKGFPKKLL
jgi:hypothetical protein